MLRCSKQVIASGLTNDKTSVFQYIFSVSAREDPVQQEGHGADPDGGAPAGRPRTPEPR